MPIPGYTGYLPPDKQRVMVVKSFVSTRADLPTRAQQAHESQQSRAFSATPDAGSAPRNYFIQKRHVGYTTYKEASQAFVRTASDVPTRATERSFYGSETPAIPNLPFEGTTVTKLAASAYVQNEDPSFFSRVRKEERIDDDARHSLEDPKTRSGAAKNLRCSAIQSKREHDPTFAPSPATFIPVPRVRPDPMTQAGANHTAIGKAPLITANSTQQLDFPDPRQAAAEARAVVDAKQGTTRLAPDRAIVGVATSRDLFMGTSKASEEVVSGFMGHVPSNPNNVKKVIGASDKQRAHSKCFLTVTAPSGNSTTSLLRTKLAAASEAAAAINGRPATPKNSSNFYASQAALAQDERNMNRVEVGRKNAVRNFFSRGVGEQDDLVADQFCIRYRPLEGMMRHGPPDSHVWVTDNELRRAPRL